MTLRGWLSTVFLELLKAAIHLTKRAMSGMVEKKQRGKKEEVRKSEKDVCVSIYWKGESESYNV